MTLRRTAGPVAAAVVAVALAGYSAWWWAAGRAVEDGVARWAEQARAQGTHVAHGGLAIGGWPFRIRVTVAAPTVADGHFAWSGERLIAESAPWNPSRIAVTLPGRQTLTVTPAVGPPLALTAPRGGGGTVGLGPGGEPAALDLGFRDVRIDTPGAPAVPVASLALMTDRPHLDPASHKETGLHIVAEAGGVRLPGPAPDGLGPDIQAVLVDLRVQGTPPRLAPRDLAAWRDTGAVVEVDALRLDWGPLSVAASATVTLDAGLQPLAAGSAEIRGAEEMLTSLEDRLRPNQIAAARTILAMLSRPPEGGGEPVIKVPVSVQNRGLYVGPLKVAPIPPIRW